MNRKALQNVYLSIRSVKMKFKAIMCDFSKLTANFNLVIPNKDEDEKRNNSDQYQTASSTLHH